MMQKIETIIFFLFFVMVFGCGYAVKSYFRSRHELLLEKIDLLAGELETMKRKIYDTEFLVNEIHNYLGLEYPDENIVIYKDHPELYFKHLRAVAQKKGVI